LIARGRGRGGGPAKACTQTRFFELGSPALKTVYLAAIGRSRGKIAGDEHARTAVKDRTQPEVTLRQPAVGSIDTASSMRRLLRFYAAAPRPPRRQAPRAAGRGTADTKPEYAPPIEPFSSRCMTNVIRSSARSARSPRPTSPVHRSAESVCATAPAPAAPWFVSACRRCRDHR
jgi:hypothetical protein